MGDTKNQQTNNMFKCQVCSEEHRVPKEGFVVNKRIQQVVDIKFNALKLNPVYDECKKEIEKAEEKLAEFRGLKKNSQGYTEEYFEEIKRKVELRREDLKMKIDQYSDEMIHNTETTQLKCRKLSEFMDNLTAEINTSKIKLDKLINQFDSFQLNDTKIIDIKQSVVSLNKSFNMWIKEYCKNSLIRNKEYDFKFKEINMKELSGCFGEKVKFCFVATLYFRFSVMFILRLS